MSISCLNTDENSINEFMRNIKFLTKKKFHVFSRRATNTQATLNCFLVNPIHFADISLFRRRRSIDIILIIFLFTPMHWVVEIHTINLKRMRLILFLFFLFLFSHHVYTHFFFTYEITIKKKNFTTKLPEKKGI